MLLYFICSVQNDEKQFCNFFQIFFGTELLVLLSCLLICSRAASCCDFVVVVAVSVLELLQLSPGYIEGSCWRRLGRYVLCNKILKVLTVLLTGY